MKWVGRSCIFHLGVVVIAASRGALAFADSAPATSSQTAEPVIGANQAGRFGLGPVIGNTLTGIGGKLWLSPTGALQFALGTDVFGNNLRGQVDAIFSGPRWNSPDGQYFVSLYLGAGAIAGGWFNQPASGRQTEFGGRMPGGLSVLVLNSPIELFTEIAPAITIQTAKSDGHQTIFTMNGAVGLRYFF